MDFRQECLVSVKKLVLIVFFIMFAFISLPVKASIEGAVQWLTTTAKSDGSFADSHQIASPYQTTSEVARTFSSARYIPAQGNAETQNYLANPPLKNTESLSRRIIAAVLNNQDSSAWIEELESQINPDGGYGEFMGYQSTNLDTAFALESFVLSGHTKSSATMYAMGFLLNHQLASGAWSDGNNDASVYVTAIAVQALSRLRTSYAGVSNALLGAQAFLLDKRSTDRTWGDTFLSTQALLALLSSLNDVTALNSSIDALMSRQAEDGSWEQSVYVTALASRVLANYKNRGAITADPNKAAIVGTVITADSKSPLDNVTITVNEIPGFQCISANDGTFTLGGLPPGSYTLMISKDGYNSISKVISLSAGEIHQLGSVTLTMKNDKGYISGTVLDAATGQPLDGVTVLLGSAEQQAITTDAAGQFEIGPLMPASYTISFVKSGYETVKGTAEVVAGKVNSILINLGAEGSYDSSPGDILGTIVDGVSGQPIVGAVFKLSNGQFASTDAHGKFTINSVARGSYSADLLADGYREKSLTLIFSPSNSGELGIIELFKAEAVNSLTTLIIKGTVINSVSGLPVSGITVSTDGIPSVVSDASGYFVLEGLTNTTALVTLSGENYQTSSFTLNASGFGTVQVDFPIYPGGDTTNSTGSTYSARGTVIDAESGEPLPGAVVTATVNGQTDSVVTTADGQFLLTNLPADIAYLSYTYPSYVKRTNTVKLAPLTLTYLGNIGLHNDSIPLPDLVVSNIDDAGAITDPRTLTYSGTINVTIMNKGNLPTEQNVSLIAFYDNDGDGKYEENVDLDLGGADSTDILDVGDNASIVIDVFGGLPFRDAPIRVMVDSKNQIEELSEDNNIALNISQKQDLPDLTASVLVVLNNDSTYPSLGLRVGNAGSAPTPDGVTVSFYEGDRENNGVFLGSAKVQSLLSGDYQDVSVENISSLDGSRDIYAYVDPENSVPELEESNNQLNITAPKLLPDLSVSHVASENAITEPSSLKLAGEVVAVIENHGSQTVNGDFSVTAFYDVNNDRNFEEGTDVVVGAVETSGDLIPGGTNNVTINVQGDAPFRDAPVFVFVDSQKQISERDEFNNIGTSSSDCRIDPPQASSLSMNLKWKWGDSSNTSQSFGPVAVGQMNDDNGDGVIDNGDIPDLVFGTGNDLLRPSMTQLVVVSGADGKELWSRSDLSVTHRGSAAIGDIDGDGLMEIVVTDLYRTKLMALENDGTLKWSVTTAPKYTQMGVADGITLADLDHDGSPEILQGNRVYGADGTLKWVGSKDKGAPRQAWGYVSIAADVDLAGDMEVIAGRTLYDSHGSVIWYRSDLPSDGLNAVGNFDEDKFPEIVLVAEGRVYLLEHNGKTKWGPIALPSGGKGGAPTVADFDGDGEPEIGVAGAGSYTVFETDGTVKWSAKTQDYSSSATGSSVFDFEADGKAEVLYADERYLHIFDGSTGNVRLKIANTSITTMEYPNVADVDNDGHAEIIVGSNPYNNYMRGIRVFEAKSGGWAPTRNLWNQHSYHITNINDDGTIPKYEHHSWLEHNTYRLNTFLNRDPLAVPDLSVAKLAIKDGSSSQQFDVRIGNGGDAPTPKGTRLSFYEGNPENGGSLLATALLDSLGANSYRDVNVTSTSIYDGSTDLYVVVDVDDVVDECNEGNNITTLPVSKVNTQLGQISVHTDNTVYPPNAPVILNGIISNTGLLVGDYSVHLRIEDSNGAVVHDFSAQSLPNIPSGSTATAVNYWNTGLRLAGSYRLHGSLTDSDGNLLDDDVTTFEIRNSAVAAPVAGLHVATDRPVYSTTDTVVIENLVQNLTVNTVLGAASLKLTIYDPGRNVEHQVSVPLSEIAPGGERRLPQSYTFSADAQGEYRIDATLINTDGMLLASDSTSYQVKEDLARSLSGDVKVATATLYQGDTQLCTDTLVNHGTLDLSELRLRQLVVNLDTANEDMSGEQGITLAHSESHSLARTFATSGLVIGMHACVLQVKIQDDWHTLGYQSFKVLEPPIRIDASMSQGPHGRLLVLLDSGTQAAGVTNTDPQGPRELANLIAQRSWLESLLKQGGWSYTIVTSADEFTRELRSGGYTTYLLQSEHVKLPESVQKELREAVFRGDGLVVAGDHDERNQHVDEALGLKVAGKLPHRSGVMLSDSTLSSAVQLSFNSSRQGLKVQTTTAEILGRYLSGDTALTLNNYGDGKSVLFASDLMAEAAQNGDSAGVLGTLLLKALATVHPESIMPVAGSVYPLHLTLVNEGISTPGQVQLKLPAGAEIVDPGIGQVVDGMVLFTFELAEAQTLNFDLWVRLPQTAGSLSFTADILTGTAPELKPYDNIAFTLQTSSASTVTDAVNTLISVQAQLGKQAQKTVQRELANAEDALANKDSEGAILALLGAGDALLDEAGEGAQLLRLTLGRALWRVSLSWLE